MAAQPERTHQQQLRLHLVVDAPRRGPLAERALALWPGSPHNQREWLRAVGVVRSTSAGWLVDRELARKAKA